VAMTRQQYIKALQEIVTRLQAIVKDMQSLGAAAPAGDLGKCPIHNVPWRRTRYGISHPPVQEGGKWCNKSDVDKLV
jgi:hypothetical protein